MSDLDLPAWLGRYGPAATMGLTIVFGLIRGWLVPAKTVDRLMKAADERVADAKAREAEWRAISADLMAQVRTLMQVARTTEQLVTAALPPAPEGSPNDPAQ